MKWSIFVCLLVCLARYCQGGALRCPPGVSDSSCTEEKSEVVTQTDSNPADVQCLAGSEWESNCHYCRCSSTGVAECLKMNKCEQGTFAEPTLCKPNTTFQRECNTCVCLDNGLGLCTLQHCRRFDDIKGTLELVEESNSEKKSSKQLDTPVVVAPKVTLSRKVRSFTTEVPKACQPGQEFRMDCNKCLCDNKGYDFSCTRIDCNAVNNNHEVRRKREVSDPIEMKCTPSSVFDRDCNVCQCTKDGNHATCTIKRCRQEKEPESEVHPADSDPDFRCNAGEQFKRDCNDCTCSADGKGVFCTIRLCDETI